MDFIITFSPDFFILPSFVTADHSCPDTITFPANFSCVISSVTIAVVPIILSIFVYCFCFDIFFETMGFVTISDKTDTITNTHI
jgi:hypothetical protein